FRVVLRGRRNVGVAELAGDVGEGDARREELRGKGVAQILRRPVPDPGLVQDAPPRSVAEVLRIEAREPRCSWPRTADWSSVPRGLPVFRHYVQSAFFRCTVPSLRTVP